MEIKSSIDEGADRNGMRLRRYRHLGLLLLLLLLLVAVSNWNVGDGKNRKKSDKVCLQECNFRRDQRYEHFKGRDILNRNDLLQLVTDAKEILIEKLKIDYGEENFSKIFMRDDGSFRPFVPFGDKSSERLKRKLMIKVLSAQKELGEKEAAFNGCDCINGDKGIPYNPAVETKNSTADEDEDKESSTMFSPLDTSFEKYIWATGGHSASAGHGNVFNESYTAFMERDLKDVFGSIGIDFQGRNHAMGGTGSAAEIAMCWKEIFGDDVDFFSWDYGMTDAGQPIRLMHYAYRGALSAGRPAFMGIRVNIDRKIMGSLEDLGMPIFVQDNDLWSEMRKAIPDTFGLSKNEINAMPEYVRNYKCDDVIEKGEPFCLDEKYSRDVCEDRQGKAPWHPGM